MLVISMDNENTDSSNENFFFTFSCREYVNWYILVIAVRQYMIQFNHIKNIAILSTSQNLK